MHHIWLHLELHNQGGVRVAMLRHADTPAGISRGQRLSQGPPANTDCIHVIGSVCHRRSLVSVKMIVLNRADPCVAVGCHHHSDCLPAAVGPGGACGYEESEAAACRERGRRQG